MKHVFTIIVLSLCVVLNTACTKEDDADAFVGRYSVSTIENATLGGSSVSYTDSGILYISKVSATRVQTFGYFATYGEVVGSNLYLESDTNTDSDGTLTIVFGVGALNGNVLTLTSTISGRLVYNGVSYPYFATAQHTCIKQQD